METAKKKNLLRFTYDGKDPLMLPADGQSFATLKVWLSDVLEQLHATPRESKQFIIAADEIFANIVSYAYAPEDDPKIIEVSLVFDNCKLMLSMIFSDRGIAFNPLEKDAELPKERIKDRIPGGIGLFLVHQFMDELHYCRQDARNVLTISKILRRETAE